MRAVIAYVSAAVAFGALDFLWLSSAAPRLYRPAIGELMADEVRWVPAVLFYALYLLGVTVLVILPALRAERIVRVAWTGALFGLVAYATYDLTNQATLRVWPTYLTVIDLAWGAFATATASVISVLATRAILRRA